MYLAVIDVNRLSQPGSLVESVSFVRYGEFCAIIGLGIFPSGLLYSPDVSLKYAAWFEPRLLLAKFLGFFDEFCERFQTCRVAKF